MTFKRYPHLERHGNDEVEGIEAGDCYIFPKIDGTNSSVWMQDGQLCFGNRNRQLSLEKDNAGFMEAMQNDERLTGFFERFPDYRLFGEWMTPHTLKTYRPDVWRRFWIFDVAKERTKNEGILRDTAFDFIEYKVYKEYLDEFGLDYLPPLKIVTNPNTEEFLHCLEINNFLIEEGKGVGEGIVIKNYGYYNKYGRQTWAKWVRSEFKEMHYREMGAPEKELKRHEQLMVEKYVEQSSLAEKTYEKTKEEHNGFSSKNIPQLLNTIFHDLVNEETWNYVKDNKFPSIDFTLLKALCFQATKRKLPNVF